MQIMSTERGGQGSSLHLDHFVDEERAILRKGNALISQLYTAIKAGQLYEPNNEGYIHKIETLMQTIEDLLRSEEAVSLEVYMHCLFFNRVKIKTEFQNYMHTRCIIEILKKRDTEGLFFAAGLTPEELGCFVRLLSEAGQPEGIPFEAFHDQLSALEIRHISIHKFSAATKRTAEERLMNIRRQSKRTFFESIYNLKAVMFRKGPEQKFGLRRIRRLVQSLVDLVAQDEPYLIGLTTMKEFDRYILNHSVNVCILAVALGQRVGLDREGLQELGLAGLFHDLGKVPCPAPDLDGGDFPEDGQCIETERHPLYGVEMLMQMKGLGDLPVRAMKAILEHHLRFDLSGYPKISKRDKIDLFSRIIAIVNEYDAATTPPFANPGVDTPERVVLHMLADSGKVFDPVLLALFINMIGLYPIGSLALLDSGELAVVLKPHVDPLCGDRPTVKVIADRNGTRVDGNILSLACSGNGTDAVPPSISRCLNPYEYKVDVFGIVSQ